MKTKRSIEERLNEQGARLSTAELLVDEYRRQIAELRTLVRMQETILRRAGLSPAAIPRRSAYALGKTSEQLGGDTIGHVHAAADLADLRRSLERSLDQTRRSA